jgi:dihydroflavonol-4-reductase
MTTLVTGAAGFLGSHVARQLVARGETVRVLVRASSSNRAISDLSLEYVTGDLRDAASLDRAMAGVKRVYHVAADYRLWAKKPKDIYDSNVGGTKNLLAAAKRAGVEQLIYTSTVATIAVDRPELPNEFTDAKLEEMVGHYKRSKWMAEREALQAAKEGLPVIVAMPTTPVGPWDWKPTPTGKIILDFLNGKMPGYVETGLNFVGVEECAAGHLLAAEHGKVGERYLLGAENLTLKGLLDLLAKITGLRCSLCGERIFAPSGERAADSSRRRKDCAAQNVCGCFAGTAGAGIPTGTSRSGTRAGGAVVSGEWVCYGGAGEKD